MRSSPIVELRQYTLYADKRDVLVDLFEASFVEGQEAAGIEVIGTFRDLDDASKFVWLRGFRTMSQRAQSLAAFYGGPVWKRHRDAANATMIDSDDVLLLRPARAGSAFTLDGRHVGDRWIVEATILSLDAAAGARTLAHFEDEIAPLIAAAGGATLASFVTDPTPNNFPVLPVREGESVFVYFAGFPSRAAHEATVRERSSAAARMPRLESAPSVLRLEPTRRSRVTGISSRKEQASG
jgi:hypothetical protein